MDVSQCQSEGNHEGSTSLTPVAPERKGCILPISTSHNESIGDGLLARQLDESQERQQHGRGPKVAAATKSATSGIVKIATVANTSHYVTIARNSHVFRRSCPVFWLCTSVWELNRDKNKQSNLKVILPRSVYVGWSEGINAKLFIDGSGRRVQDCKNTP